MPREKEDALKLEREIRAFLRPSHISTKNVASLREPGPSRCKVQPQPDHDRLLIDVGEPLVRFA
jgi:hypothetical protein